MHARPKTKLLRIEEARENRTPIDWRPADIATPSFLGVRAVEDVSLDALSEFIDWTPFFHTWELQRRFSPDSESRKVRRAGAHPLRRSPCAPREIIAKKRSRARGVYGFFPANAVGDDVELYFGRVPSRVLATFHFLRQQAKKDNGEPNRSLADFIAPERSGPSRPPRRLRRDDRLRPQGVCDALPRKHDDYNAIMAEALADRLAEAFAEYLHKRGARRVGLRQERRI